VSGLFCHDLPTRPLRGAGTVFVTGASGYIGGRLVPELLARGYPVRTMVRADPSACAVRWPGVEPVEADALNPESLRKALSGVHTAYFDARGFLGKIYWYLFWPFHHSIFQGLIEQIEQRA
jgi:nucleoside-diphosphate-sugar epimerase